MKGRDMTALAIAGVAACAGAVRPTFFPGDRRQHWRSRSADTNEYDDPDLADDERAAGALRATDHPGRPCAQSDDEFMEGCFAAHRAAP